MSTRKPKPHEIHTALVHGKNLREDYATYLKEEGLEDSYKAADRFAGRVTQGDTVRAYGMKEREIIIALAGKIDPMYD